MNPQYLTVGVSIVAYVLLVYAALVYWLENRTTTPKRPAPPLVPQVVGPVWDVMRLVTTVEIVPPPEHRAQPEPIDWDFQVSRLVRMTGRWDDIDALLAELTEGNNR